MAFVERLFAYRWTASRAKGSSGLVCRKSSPASSAAELDVFVSVKLDCIIGAKTDGIVDPRPVIFTSTELMKSSARRHDVIASAELTESSAQSLTYCRL